MVANDWTSDEPKPCRLTYLPEKVYSRYANPGICANFNCLTKSGTGVQSWTVGNIEDV